MKCRGDTVNVRSEFLRGGGGGGGKGPCFPVPKNISLVFPCFLKVFCRFL